MIIHNATLYIREKDQFITGPLHVNNGLVIVELDGDPNMDQIRDYVRDRVTEGHEFSTRDCQFMTATNWSTMLANQVILGAMEDSRETKWVDDIVKPKTGFWNFGKKK